MFRNTGANAFAKNQMRLAYEDKRDLYCNHMPDKYAERQDECECRGQGILSFVSDLYSSDAVYHR